MSEENEKIEKFIIKYEEKPVRIEGYYWCADHIYLSDVCLAVEVKPANDKLDLKENASQEELYALLRGISNRALDHDLMRPLAGFIADVTNKTALEQIRSWGADQDWHRGAFTLYLIDEDKELGPTLEELLAPRPELLRTDQYVERSNSEIMKGVYESLTASSGELSKELEALFKVLEGALEAADKKVGEKEKVVEVEKHLNDWSKKNIEPDTDAGGVAQ